MTSIKYLSLEVSSKCQLSCEWCARKIMTRRPGNMSLKTAQIVSEQFDEFKDTLDCAVFNCWGEPTMNPNLLEIMDLFVHRGVKTVVSTNCVDYVEGLTDSGVDELILHVDQLKGRRKNNAIKYILNSKKIKLLYIQMMITPSTQQMAEEFVKMYQPYTEGVSNVKVFLKYPIIDGIADQYTPLRDGLDKLIDWRYEKGRHKGRKKAGKARKILVAGKPFMPRNKYCMGLRGGITVLDDGTLVLECCQVNKEMRIGHIKGGIVKNFNGAPAKVWRKNFPNAGPCKACKEMVIAGGEE